MLTNVEEADKKADELLKELYPDQFEDQKEDDDKKNDGEETGDNDGDNSREDESNAGGETDHTDDGEASKTGDEGSEDGAKQKPDQWEQRYKVLKGKYDKEVPELHRTVKNLQEEIASIKESLSSKRAEKKTQLEEDKTTDPDIEYLEQEFPDIHRAVAKMLQEAKGPKVEERLRNVEGNVLQQAKDKFFKDLSESCSDWETIRDDERFTEWLNEVDELTDAPRYQLAVIAQNNLNGKQLGRFYNRFKKEVLGTTSNTSGKNEKDLEKHTGMPKSKSGKQPDTGRSNDNETVSREDIRKFYKDAASGKFIGDEDAFKRMESKIHKAMQEGRIV